MIIPLSVKFPASESLAFFALNQTAVDTPHKMRLSPKPLPKLGAADQLCIQNYDCGASLAAAFNSITTAIEHSISNFPNLTAIRDANGSSVSYFHLNQMAKSLAERTNSTPVYC